MRGRRDEAARLLSDRDRLSVIEKEQVFDRVLRSLAVQAPKRRWQWWSVRAAALAAATAAAVTVTVARLHTDDESDFIARGSTVPAYAVRCGEAQSCRNGETLVFHVTSAAGFGYFAALADGSDGTRIWYFPGSAAPTSIPLVETGTGVLPRGVLLGGEHRPGEYEVIGIFSRAPLGKEELRAALAPGGEPANADLQIVRRRLVVE